MDTYPCQGIRFADSLRLGQIVEKTFWVQIGKATKDAFGFEQAMDVSLDLFKPYRSDCYEPFERICRAKRDYAMTRWIDAPAAADGKFSAVCGFNMYDSGNGMTDVYEREHRRREIVLGWCGQALNCIAKAIRFAEKSGVGGLDSAKWRAFAERSLDARCEDKEGAYAAFQGYVALLRNAIAREGHGR